MENLAYTHGVVDGLIKLAEEYPVPVGIVAGIIAIGVLILVMWAKLSPDEPTDEGPRLTGTAQVLSFEKGTRVADSATIMWGTRTQPKLYMCRIELEVHILGREPYVRVMQKPLNRATLAAAQPGRTFPVEVDEANPEEGYFSIDFSQPVPPSG